LLVAMDKIQPKIFSMILEKVWMAGMESVVDEKDKKICVVGIARLLCQSPELLAEPYLRAWPVLLGGVVKLIQGETTPGKEEGDLLDLSDKGFNTAMARLAFAPDPKHDPVAHVKDAKEVLFNSLGQLTAQYPGKFDGMIGQLPEQQRTQLTTYMSQRKVG